MDWMDEEWDDWLVRCEDCGEMRLPGGRDCTMSDERVLGVLTGQVPVAPPCREHREVAHSAEGDRWCNNCGWTRGGNGVPARRRARPNGGFA